MCGCCFADERQSWDEIFRLIVNKSDCIIAEMEGCELNEPLDPQRRMFQDFVTCEICQDMYDDPRLMPCNHTFCKSCLEEWQQKNGDDSSFPCPKCRIVYVGEVDKLAEDLRASQLVERIVHPDMIQKSEFQSLGSMPTSMTNLYCDDDLADWLTKNKLPKQVTKALFENGFQFLDIVLEMTASDVKKLGLKTGHERKLLKCLGIRKHSLANVKLPTTEELTDTFKKSLSNITERFTSKEDVIEWKLVKDLYDDRIISTGTNPADSAKFWASLSKASFDKIIQTVKKQANIVLHDQEMCDSLKAECLHEAAMVLCDAGSYEQAKFFIKKAISFEENESKELEMKVLLVFAKNNSLKISIWEGLSVLAEWTNWESKKVNVRTLK